MSSRFASARRVAIALATCFTLACSGPTVTPDGSPGDAADREAAATDAQNDTRSDTPSLDAVTMCTTDNECSDGAFCNGAERCMPGASGANARGCVAASAPACMANQTCDEAGDRCTTTCVDADGDGHMTPACGGDDCDDMDPNRFPGNTEVCAFDATTMTRVDPGHDEDCNAMTYANATTGDGDHDNDGYVDHDCLNHDASGNTFRGPDCQDINGVDGMSPFMTHVQPGNIHPSQTEACNGVDDNCDGTADEGLPTGTYYPDCDGDNFGDQAGTAMMGCGIAQFPLCMGHQVVPNHDDCNDAAAAVRPGGAEVCNGIDDDCNGTVDDPAITNAACMAMFPSVPHGTVGCGMSGACAIATCATGYSDCDRTLSNGCEAALQTDTANCGTCGHACGIGSSCVAGVCDHLVAIDAGAAHTCAIYARGTAVCWGANNEGQLGNGSRTDSNVPVPVSTTVGTNFTWIDAGGYRTEQPDGRPPIDQGHTCAGNGMAAYCWGRNIEGQLGNGTMASSNTPVVVSMIPLSMGGTGIPALRGIAAGGDHSIAYQIQPRSGFPGGGIYTPYSWGLNTSGQLGIVMPTGTTCNGLGLACGATPCCQGGTCTGGTCTMVTTTSTPTRVNAAQEEYGVGAGPRHSCVVGPNGTLFCTGDNAQGQLGVTGGNTNSLVTVPLPSGFYTVDVSAGGIGGSGPTPSGRYLYTGSTTCALSSLPNTVYCFGSNNDGQRGTATANTTVTGLTDAVQVAVGGRHACARRSGGTIVCWGADDSGQLGNSAGATGSMTPVTVSGITDAIWVTAGALHSCAIRSDFSAWCWGQGDKGQLGNGTSGSSGVPVRVSGL